MKWHLQNCSSWSISHSWLYLTEWWDFVENPLLSRRMGWQTSIELYLKNVIGRLCTTCSAALNAWVNADASQYTIVRPGRKSPASISGVHFGLPCLRDQAPYRIHPAAVSPEEESRVPSDIVFRKADSSLLYLYYILSMFLCNCFAIFVDIHW